jgi:hypothetical protein
MLFEYLTFGTGNESCYKTLVWGQDSSKNVVMLDSVKVCCAPECQSGVIQALKCT